MDFSNRDLLIGKKIDLHLKREPSGRVVSTVSADILKRPAAMSGTVVGYDSIGMLIETDFGVITLITWGTFEGYNLVAGR